MEYQKENLKGEIKKEKTNAKTIPMFNGWWKRRSSRQKREIMREQKELNVKPEGNRRGCAVCSTRH